MCTCHGKINIDANEKEKELTFLRKFSIGVVQELRLKKIILYGVVMLSNPIQKRSFFGLC